MDREFGAGDHACKRAESRAQDAPAGAPAHGGRQ